MMRKHWMKVQQQNLTADVVVVGGGMAGVCAAVSASRGGAHRPRVPIRGVGLPGGQSLAPRL